MDRINYLNYQYDQDSVKSGLRSIPSCCLNSVCVSAVGRPAGCHELRILCSFRDEYLLNRPDGREDIQQYYDIASCITEKIESSNDSQKKWRELYEILIVPCINLIEEHKYDEAYEKYKRTLLSYASDT